MGFLGKNDNWIDDITFRSDVISYVSAMCTRFNPDVIVVSNQAGIARKMFTPERVEEVNGVINAHLVDNNIKVKAWLYSPEADMSYAKLHPEMEFDPRYIKAVTTRKPSTALVERFISESCQSLSDYSRIIVIGDRIEDQELAKRLSAEFVDARGKLSPIK